MAGRAPCSAHKEQRGFGWARGPCRWAQCVHVRGGDHHALRAPGASFPTTRVLSRGTVPGLLAGHQDRAETGAQWGAGGRSWPGGLPSGLRALLSAPPRRTRPAGRRGHHPLGPPSCPIAPLHRPVTPGEPIGPHPPGAGRRSQSPRARGARGGQAHGPCTCTSLPASFLESWGRLLYSKVQRAQLACN